ncbi:BT4734/BF3469 family protein [Flavihumibacter sp. ZG627]|uniref:BT4734/BF3469 family protein n=1 Tax=Flavihumibacter sp. ZG627 TaxID=1463156 RepID=UPI0005804839|nr:BT4734/BF3469 family protein [Flavihumibacter sp. ZG627]KIC89996.1 hypothetical protein HY58_13380 [Flavihumibacter sp. ZG627]
MWLEKQVSLYRSVTDNTGRAATLRQILLTECANDIGTITAIRKLDRQEPDYKTKQVALKNRVQCFTPAALLKSKAKGSLEIISRSGLMQLDFDPYDIWEYDLEELKNCVFSLPFIAFCGKSVSGDGFYALANIAEPERLKEYAEHCFKVLEGYGIKADTSKGRNPQDLRFISYDANMLIRDNPEALKIPPSKPKEAIKSFGNTYYPSGNNAGLIRKAIAEIETVQEGRRWATVQHWAYTLGGKDAGLDQIIEAINRNAEFIGNEPKYIQCARDCFRAGQLKPF